MGCELYELAAPRKAFLASICRASTDLPVTKIRLWASFGCRSGLDGGPFETTFFGDVETKKPGKSSPSVRVLYRNRSGVVELVEREPLMFARVENGVTKFSPKKQKSSKFWIRNGSFQCGNFLFFGRGKTTFFGGGGGITSNKLARQWPSWGIYKHAPPVFWREKNKIRLLYLYWEKGGQIKRFSWGGQLVGTGCTSELLKTVVTYTFIRI